MINGCDVPPKIEQPVRCRQQANCITAVAAFGVLRFRPVRGTAITRRHIRDIVTTGISS